jgi:hypothetical protein
LKEEEIRPVYTADGTSITPLGKGIIKFGDIEIRDVYLIPEMKDNLLSMRQLTARGLKIKFETNRMVVTFADRSEYVSKLGTDKLYHWYFDRDQNWEQKVNNVMHRTHRLFGHVGKAKTKEMAQILNDKTDQSEEPCEVCEMGKGIKVKFFKGVKEESDSGIISLDLTGPLPPGPNGEKYVLLLIHHETKVICVETLASKGDQTETIKWFVMHVKERGFKVHTVKCDNSKENLSNLLLEFYQTHGIELKSSNRYTSNQNSVAERWIRTLMDRARCYMHDSRLPEFFWPFAVKTAAYILNRTVITGAQVTPHQLFTGKEPEFNRLWLFGCIAYMLIPKEVRRNKIQARAEECIFLGYSNNGYIGIVKSGKIQYSRDMKFFESRKGGELYLFTRFVGSSRGRRFHNSVEDNFIENNVSIYS